MSKFVVPQLRQKLLLLARHGTLQDFAAIAETFRITEEGLRYWTKESAGRVAGTVPNKHVTQLIELFHETLSELDVDQISGLLTGPLVDLESAYGNKETLSFWELVEAEASQGMGALIPMERNTIDIVEPSGNRRRTSDITYPLGADFRIEFHSRHNGRFTIGLQKSPQGWGCVSSSVDRQRSLIHLPQFDDEQLGAICERNDEGISTFVVLQSATPIPPAFQSSLRDGVPLARSDLNFLALYVSGLPKSERKLFVLDVEFTKD